MEAGAAIPPSANALILTVCRIEHANEPIERRPIMHDTGIVRRVDDLGRIVIPMELRRTLGIKVKDPMAIFVEGDRIILQKHRDVCTICGDASADMHSIKGRPVCASCVAEMKRA